MAIKVVNPTRTSLFLLIFSIVTYVRDAGVAGSNPATPTKKSLGFLPLFPSIFKASHRNPVPGCNGICCPVREVRVMVAISSQQRLSRPTRKARPLPDRHATLHSHAINDQRGPTIHRCICLMAPVGQLRRQRWPGENVRWCSAAGGAEDAPLRMPSGSLK
jgi:hypothetical protein